MRLVDIDAIPYLLDRVAEKMVVTKDVIESLPTYEVHKIEKSVAVDNEAIYQYGHYGLVSHIGHNMANKMLGDIANYTELTSITDYKTEQTIVKCSISVVVPPEKQK